MNNRLEVLDSLRGLAALVVVIFHFTYRYYQIYPQETKMIFSFYEGKYGVQAFFIISGFVIFMTLNRVERPIDFIMSRFARLYPVFWFCMLLTFTIVFLLGLEGRERTITEMIINLTMIPSVFNTPYVDGVYWTLLYELKFYFWIFVIFSIGQLKNINIIILTYIIIAFIVHFTEYDSFFINILYKLFIFDTLPYFLSGILFYQIYFYKRDKFVYLTLFLCFLYCHLTNHYNNGLISLTLIYLLFLFFSFRKLNWLSNKFFIYLGTISYSLYLIHQNIGYIILNNLYLLNLQPLISFSITLFLVILIATLITYFIEKPSITFFKKLFKSNEFLIQKLSNKNLFKFLYKKMK